MFIFLIQGKLFNLSTWISLSKCQILQTIASSFIFFKCSIVMISLFQVVVT